MDSEKNLKVGRNYCVRVLKENRKKQNALRLSLKGEKNPLKRGAIEAQLKFRKALAEEINERLKDFVKRLENS